MRIFARYKWMMLGVVMLFFVSLMVGGGRASAASVSVSGSGWCGWTDCTLSATGDSATGDAQASSESVYATLKISASGGSNSESVKVGTINGGDTFSFTSATDSISLSFTDSTIKSYGEKTRDGDKWKYKMDVYFYVDGSLIDSDYVAVWEPIEVKGTESFASLRYCEYIDDSGNCDSYVYTNTIYAGESSYVIFTHDLFANGDFTASYSISSTSGYSPPPEAPGMTSYRTSWSGNSSGSIAIGTCGVSDSGGGSPTTYYHTQCNNNYGGLTSAKRYPPSGDGNWHATRDATWVTFYNPGTYTFTETISSGGKSSSITLTVKVLPFDFSGKADTKADGQTTTTDWRKSDNKVTQQIECRNSGCTPDFALHIRNNLSVGQTKYRLAGVVSSGWTDFSAKSEAKQVGSGSKKIYAGKTACSSIEFYPLGVTEFGYEIGSTATEEACAEAKVTQFYGKIDITGDASASTGFVQSSDGRTTGRAIIYDCPYSGCYVKFNHQMKREVSIGSTTYSIKRVSNYSTVESGTLKEVTTFDENGPTTVLDDNSIKLVPGQVVCETITFRPDNDTGTGISILPIHDNTSVTACASALGKAQPDSETLIDINVKNDNGADRYKTYQSSVYAKPHDTVYWETVYNPKLQYTTKLIPECMEINSGSSSTNSGYTLQQFFNRKYSGKDWNSAFSVKSSSPVNSGLYNLNLDGRNNYNVFHDIGVVSTKTTNNRWDVLTAEVGKTLTQTAATNQNSKTQTTPGQVEFINGSGNCNTANVDTSARSDVAEVRVPINYNTATKITTPDEKLYHAGEEGVVSFEVSVIPKTNSYTTNGSASEAYATNIVDSRRKVIVYYPGNRSITSRGSDSYGSGLDANLCSHFGLANNETDCGYTSVKKQTLNANDDMHLSKTYNTNDMSAKFIAQDLPAGSKICFAVAFYPANSGADYNMDAKGSDSWRISDSKCYTIAKKPNFQVWGGTIYSTGDFTTSISPKQHLQGYNDYQVRIPGTN